MSVPALKGLTVNVGYAIILLGTVLQDMALRSYKAWELTRGNINGYVWCVSNFDLLFSGFY